jgi:predicted nucleic acid-binding protein
MKVYLETSFVSACVSTRLDPKSVYRRDVSLEWWRTQRNHHVLFVSNEFLHELSNSNYPRATEANAWIASVPCLSLSDEILDLAQLLIREKVMPQTLSGDAVHVAVATVNSLQYILSWNVRHLANPRKREHLRKILWKVGRIPPEIATPEMLWVT